MTSEGTGTLSAEERVHQLAEEVAARDDGPLTEEPTAPETPGATETSPVESAAAPVEAEPAAPPDAVGTTETPQAPVSPETPSPVPSERSETPENPTPLRFRADGREVEIPGAVREPDGTIRIPPDAWRHFQPYLRDSKAVNQQIASLSHQAKQLAEQVTARTHRGDALWDQLVGMTDGWKQAILSGDPSKVEQFYLELAQNLPVMQEKARAAQAEAELTALRSQQSQVAEQEQIQQLHATVKQSTDDWAKWYVGQEAFRGLDPAKVARIFWDMRHDLWFEADQPIPEWGLQPGQIGFNHQVAQQRLAELASEHRATQAAIQAAQAAAAKNQAALGVSPAPPAVSAKAPVGTEKAPEMPKTMAEYRDYMERLASRL